MCAITIWGMLRNAGLSREGTAGVMGNLGYESHFHSNNVEDGRSSMSDEEYTKRVDNGSYDRHSFCYDGCGYGLAQWTFFSRKAGLYDLAKSRGVSIADERLQIDFLLKELKTENAGLYRFLCSTDDVTTAVIRFCNEFEKPSVARMDKRLEEAFKVLENYK